MWWTERNFFGESAVLSGACAARLSGVVRFPLGSVTKQTLQQVADAIVGADPGSESGAGSACLPNVGVRMRERPDTSVRSYRRIQSYFVAGPKGPSQN